MNTLNVISRVKQELDDQGIFYTDEDIFDSLQDGYDEIVLYSGCIEKIVSVPFPVTPYYNLLSVIPDFYRVFAIYNPNNKQFLEPITFQILDGFTDEWETETGTPQWFVPIDFKYIAFYPYYAAVPSLNMYVMYYAQAPDFTTSNNLEIPSNHQGVIENYVVNDLLDQSLEFKKSTTIFKTYLSELEKLKKEVERRNQSDRIQQMMVKINANLD